nr:phage baseplate assembly protein V [Aestuariivirga sp. YIM B02566]
MIRRVEDAERRIANVARPGKVEEADYEKGLVKVKVGDLQSAWVPWRTRAGSQRLWDPPAVGEQVMLFSPSGEPGQGWADWGGFSNGFQQNHNKGGEYKLTLGASSIHITGQAIVIKQGGSTITITDGKIKQESDEIVADGECHFGGEGGVPAAMLGSIDSDGDTEVENLATKVFVQ